MMCILLSPQSGPDQSGWHSQEKLSYSSTTHVPPCAQGFGQHVEVSALQASASGSQTHKDSPPIRLTQLLSVIGQLSELHACISENNEIITSIQTCVKKEPTRVHYRWEDVNYLLRFITLFLIVMRYRYSKVICIDVSIHNENILVFIHKYFTSLSSNNAKLYCLFRSVACFKAIEHLVEIIIHLAFCHAEIDFLKPMSCCHGGLPVPHLSPDH